MTEKKKGDQTFKIILGGEARTCRLTLGAFRFAQRVHGSDIDPAQFQSGGLKLSSLPTAVWVSLLHEEPELTEDEVLKLMMSLKPDEEANIMYVLGRAIADIAESAVSFGKGIESAEMSEGLREATEKASESGS